ncbi:geranylgeranyl diphosphate synthase CrtE [Spirulina subsalsa]|uniref:geranylgeranyl diphosphate synthase CrtE n=1 Tax=Spirulina subsalsa TaxID=54311 RepID=UPI0003004623|nr:farnesyl diphosphate synthase [Spirulina subsalsa]
MVTTDGKIATSENSAFDLVGYLAEQKVRVEEALDQLLPITEPPTIYKAMRYSLLAGGKRLRPTLCLATCTLLGGTAEMAMPTACAMEVIHTMSLIHDDLPAMDNDDYRRGQLTNHKVFGEDMAILAGDALLAYAFELIASQTEGVPPERVLKAIAHLAHAAGAGGLVGGQVVDLESEGKADITVDTLTFIHTHKTGALLEACVICGALIAGAGEEDLQRLSRYAKNIGLAFQIVDDILDITSTQEELGKTAGKDLAAQKVTYPSLWGIEESRVQAQRLIDEAIAALANYDTKADPLRALARFIVERKN